MYQTGVSGQFTEACSHLRFHWVSFLLTAGVTRSVAFIPPLVLERRYPKEVQDLYETMRRFARILGPVEHDKFIESHACKYFEDFSIYVLQQA